MTWPDDLPPASGRAPATAQVPVLDLTRGQPMPGLPAAPPASDGLFPTAAPSPRPRRRRLWLGVALVVLLVGGLVAVLAVQDARHHDAATVAARSNAAKTAVTGYLTALADGDSAAALAVLAARPDDTVLLTDQVLSASRAAAPITGVSVSLTSISSDSADVTAEYTLGHTPATADYALHETNGTWLIENGTSELTWGDGLGALALTVNGQAVTGTGATVFPGSYILATTSAGYALGGTTTFPVTGPDPVDAGAATPALSDAGVAAFRSAVTAAAQACVASTALAAGCGLGLPGTLVDGTVLTDGTVTRTLSADGTAALAALTPTLDAADPTVARVGTVGAVDAAATCTQGARSGHCQILAAPSLGRVSVRMTDPALPVTWG